MSMKLGDVVIIVMDPERDDFESSGVRIGKVIAAGLDILRGGVIIELDDGRGPIQAGEIRSYRVLQPADEADTLPIFDGR